MSVTLVFNRCEYLSHCTKVWCRTNGIFSGVSFMLTIDSFTTSRWPKSDELLEVLWGQFCTCAGRNRMDIGLSALSVLHASKKKFRRQGFKAGTN